MTTEYPRGSEWRRWDLHIHTPETMKNDQYTGSTAEEKWHNFYTDISNYIGDGNNIDKNIAVVGITDYLSIENYKKIIANQQKLPNTIKLILPNVEMRIQPIAQDSPINMHFIFNPDIVDDLESRFFSKIIFTDGNVPYDASRASLIRFGRKVDDSLTNDTAYKKGIEQFVPSFDSVQKVLQEDKELRDNVIIGVSNSTYDGVSGAVAHSSYLENGESQLKTFRQSIYRFVDIIFSATPSDIAYFLGRKPSIPTDEVRKQCGTLKPCIIGSDAHTNSKIFEPDNKKYCWIKADPTFNGLKQILYEPEERVRISETQPEIKEDYYVIDRVEFDNKDFQTDPIYFNDKLTCIIGGKSTGKSILLQNMANRIDPLEAQKNIKKSETKTLEITNLRVFWRDGEEKDRKIIYIPQTYLNKLSDSKQEKTEIDQWIQEVLFQREEIKKAYEVYSLAIRDLSIDVNTNIINFISKNEECIENIKAQKDIGDKQGIISTIQKLELERTVISKDLEISEDDIKTYNNALGNIQKANDNIKKLEQDKTIILSIDSVVQNKNLNPSISELSKDNILKIQEDIVNTANQKWQDAKISIIKEIEDKKAQEKTNLKSNTSLFFEKKPLIDGSNAIIEKSKRIQEEKRKQKLLEEKEKVLEALVEERNKFLEYLCLVPEKYKKINHEYQNIINTAKIEDEDISFFADVVFRSEALTEKLSTLFDVRNKNYKEIVKDSLSETDYTRRLREIIEKTINDELSTKNGFSKEDVLREILISWYNTTYKVKMEEDTLDVMSPGKKALVLLKVLIGLAENKCPILIDQPEDDLDNRSIYGDLVDYIKEKKKERQIIIVTHNANIVIGSDAEEVIVANQEGKNSPNKEFRFEYKSGAIEDNTPMDKRQKIEDTGILNSQGIQYHICDILEGGQLAFELRKKKYHI